MKKLLLIIFIALASAQVVDAQDDNYYGHKEDVITGKDGVAIHGKIIEEVPGVSYKIQTRNGDVYMFYAEDVAKITTEAPVYQTPSGRRIDEIPSRKNPAVAMICSFIIPGLGQFVNDDYLKGLAIFAGYGVGVCTMLVSLGISSETGASVFVGGLLICAGCSLYSIIEAPLSALRYNRANGFALGNGNYLRLSPDLAINNTISRGTDASYGMRMTLTF